MSLMYLLQNSLTTLDEIVFENRNKNYGAYELRKRYLRHLLTALAATMIFSAVCVGLLLALPGSGEDIFKNVDYRTSDFSLEEVKIPKVVIEKSQAPKATAQNENLPPIVDEEETETVEETKNETSPKIDSKEEKLGEKGLPQPDEKVKSISSDTTGTETYSEEIFLKVETNAVFPGGEEEFKKFIDGQIKYPDYALRNKIEGIIYVHMIINRDGSITDLKIYRGIEESCNAEVLRIMQRSPKWIPARKDGKFVRQRLIVPIKFKVSS